MRLSISVTLVWCGVARAFVPSPSRTRAQSGLVLRSTVEEEEVAAAIPTVESVATATDATDSMPGDSSSVGGAEAAKPGIAENAKFQCEDSVEFWSSFQREGFSTAQENLQELGNIGTRFAQMGPKALSYWLVSYASKLISCYERGYGCGCVVLFHSHLLIDFDGINRLAFISQRHAGRSGYFGANALLGNAGFMLHERLVNNKETTFTGALPFNMDSAVASRLFLEAALCYEQDYAKIEDGEYREPWDMQLGHRQSSPVNVATQTSRFISEAIGTLGRRTRGEQKDRDTWITDPASPTLYPEYYRTAFHYQTDGWMSKKSADVYEASTETLFLGRQDSMQRTSLPALVAQSKKLAGDERPMKVLEVAAGTGRFMTFARDNLPLDTEYTAVDLSPYYLDAARENDKYWRKTRREEENRNGGNMGRDDIKPARLIQAQAEDLPFEDESFDAVVCVYLYHELPRDVRAKVSAEMARVLKQDGTLVFTDSIQLGDRPALDEGLVRFEGMNEPYYMDYCADDLTAHFEKVGLEPLTKTVRSTTKMLSFLKPVCDVGDCEV